SAEAVQAAHMAVALSSEQTNLRRQLSKSLMANSEWQAALEELEGIITRQSSPTAGDLYAVAQCALQLDMLQRAAQACQQALHIDAQNGAVHALLGKALIRLGDPQNALQHYEKATQYAPHLAAPWLVLVEDQLENDMIEQALETLQTAKNAAPESPEIHLELGKLYLERNEATNALYVLERADNLFSKAPGQPVERIQETMLVLSKALVASGRLEHARQKLEQANQAFPTNIDIAHAYAKTLIELDEYQPAISALAVILHERPDDVDMQLDYAQAHLALKKHPDQAIKALQKVLALAPDHSKALALLAEAEVLNGDLDSALQTYQNALESDLASDPNWRVRLCLGLGKTAHQLKRYEVAIAALQEASQAQPDNVGTLKSLAEAYLATGLRKDAMQVTHEVYALEPDDPATLMWFSNLAVKFKRHDEAITALRRAAQLAPQQTDILVRLGYVQLHIGESEAAKATFDKLFNTGTARTSDLREAAVALMGLGETASGIAYLKRALELSPEPQPELLGELATAYYEAGDHEAALESLDQRIELAPNDPNLLVTKSDLLLEMDRPQGALACLEHAIQMTPNQAHLHHRAALILRAASDLPAALNHAEEAVNLLQAEPAYRLLAAETARASLRNDEAHCLLGETEDGSQAISLADTSVAEGIQYLCLQAELALAAGEEIMAANAIAPVLDMQPDNLNAAALQARLSYRHGDEQAAQENLDTALSALADINLDALPPHLAANHCLSVAEAALEIGRWPAALELAHRAVETTTLEPRPHLILAQAIVLQAEYQHLCADVEAIKHAPGSSALDERNQQIFEEAITAAMRCAPFEDTHQEIEHWQVRGYDVFHPHLNKRAKITSYPANAAEAASAIMAMRKTGDTDQMEAVAGKFAAAPAVLTQLTITLIRQGVPKALAAAKKLLSLQPSDIISQALFAQVCEKAEDHPKALEMILQALSAWEDEPRWHATAARLYQKLDELTDAVCHLEQAIQLEPDHIAHYLALGKVYLQSGAPGNAIRVLEQAAELSADTAEIWRSLAQAQQASTELEAAAASAEKAIKLNPRQIEPLLLRAEIALQAKSAQKAEGFVQTALRLKPKDPNALLLLAQACEAQERFQDAIAALDEAAGLALEPFEILMARVQLIGKAQGADARLLALKKLLRRYPDHPKVLAELSQALVHAGQSEPAIEIAQMAVKDKANLLTDREKAGLHYQLGKMLHKAGQLDQSVHHLSKSIELDTAQLDAYLEIGRVYQKRRRLDQAQVAYQHAIALAPNDSRPYWEAAQALKESKDYVGAEAMLRKAAALVPKDLNIQRQLGAVIALKLVHQPQEVQS
ncbi:MAG: tetratricopeptide repeat protein, partial [Anaerolineales bacterium]|nr:tetratricopeptide repeat protein [Anaerolineales bacterium]